MHAIQLRQKRRDSSHERLPRTHHAHTAWSHNSPCPRARGRPAGAVTRCRRSRRRASGRGTGGRQLEGGGSRASGSRAARGHRRRGPRHCERRRRRRSVQWRMAATLRVASVFAKTMNRKNSSCPRSRGRRVLAVSASSRLASFRQHSLSAAIMHGRSPGRRAQWHAAKANMLS